MGSNCINMKYVCTRICLAGVTVGLLGQVGCSQSVDIAIPNCGTVMIEDTSSDANNTVMDFVTSDCSREVVPGATEGEFVITIDIVADDGSTPKPRVLFTLKVVAEELPRDTPISLEREGDDTVEDPLPLAPAVYQEVDPELEAAGEETLGPFWSSNGGTISFTEQENGTLLGDFNFTADNPGAFENTALGTISVQGTVILNPILTLKTPCGMQSFSIGMVTLMGLCLVRFGLRRRPRL